MLIINALTCFLLPIILQIFILLYRIFYIKKTLFFSQKLKNDFNLFFTLIWKMCESGHNKIYKEYFNMEIN